jgi:hypothetical protein
MVVVVRVVRVVAVRNDRRVESRVVVVRVVPRIVIVRVVARVVVVRIVAAVGVVATVGVDVRTVAAVAVATDLELEAAAANADAAGADEDAALGGGGAGGSGQGDADNRGQDEFLQHVSSFFLECLLVDAFLVRRLQSAYTARFVCRSHPAHRSDAELYM